MKLADEKQRYEKEVNHGFRQLKPLNTFEIKFTDLQITYRVYRR